MAMNIPTFKISKDDLIGGRLHPPGVMVVTISGPHADKMTSLKMSSYSKMRSILEGPVGFGAGCVDNLYTLDDSHRWYVTLTEPAHALHFKKARGRTFQMQTPEMQLTLQIEHLDPEEGEERP